MQYLLASVLLVGCTSSEKEPLEVGVNATQHGPYFVKFTDDSCRTSASYYCTVAILNSAYWDTYDELTTWKIDDYTTIAPTDTLKVPGDAYHYDNLEGFNDDERAILATTDEDELIMYGNFLTRDDGSESVFQVEHAWKSTSGYLDDFDVVYAARTVSVDCGDWGGEEDMFRITLADEVLTPQNSVKSYYRSQDTLYVGWSSQGFPTYPTLYTGTMGASDEFEVTCAGSWDDFEADVKFEMFH